MVVIFFRPIAHTFLLLFFASMTLCTVFELLIGLGMEKLFGARWWDYSNKKFNFRGYICPGISILWGLGCVIVVRVVHPMVEKVVDRIPVKLGFALIAVWSVLIVIDLISSICAVNKLNNRLKQIDEISKIMLMSAVKIGENLSHETLDVKEKYDKLIEARDAKTQALKQRYEKIVSAADFKIGEWKERYEGLVNLRDRSVERLLKAFPHMRSISYSESMETLRKRLNSRISLSRSKSDKNAENVGDGEDGGE